MIYSDIITRSPFSLNMTKMYITHKLRRLTFLSRQDLRQSLYSAVDEGPAVSELRTEEDQASASAVLLLLVKRWLASTSKLWAPVSWWRLGGTWRQTTPGFSGFA